MPVYLVSCGNSSTGPVGFCARVRASSKEEAIEIIREAMPECEESDPYDDRVEYFNFYTNHEAVTVADIDDGETEEDADAA